MTQIKVKAPSKIDANIKLPASKSISNRALIINALSSSASHPENLSECDDTMVMVRALSNKDKQDIDIMAAGTAMRFLTAYYSVTPGCDKILTGSQRMKNRPISILVDALRTLGANIEYAEKDGYPPLHIKGGTLHGKDIEIPGNVSSQYISALLMIGATLHDGLELRLTGEIISKPYIELTLGLINKFGAKAYWTDGSSIRVEHSQYATIPFYIENDWSAASYWYEIVALSDDAKVQLPKLFKESMQGDCMVARIFEKLGVTTEYTDEYITLTKSGNVVKELDYDFVCQPDLAQTFVVTCSLLDIPFRFTGLQSLKIKETDRIEALKREMLKLGYVIEDSQDSILSWDGKRTEASLEPIDTYEDHRMAMAFAPASIKLESLAINNPEVVSKSYPCYFNDLEKAGFIIEKKE